MNKSVDSGRPGTRERLLDAAMRLFARKGVSSTTVGEIEATAGLSPRSGALYKYFDSKDALLAAGLEQHLATMRDIEQELALRPLGEIRAEFTMLGHWLLHELEVERDITHILEREGDQVGAIRDRIRTGISDRSYLIGADVLGRWRPDLEQARREALSVIAVGALINYKRSAWTFGLAPLDLDEEILVQSWVEVCVAVIAKDP